MEFLHNLIAEVGLKGKFDCVFAVI